VNITYSNKRVLVKYIAHHLQGIKGEWEGRGRMVEIGTMIIEQTVL